MRTIHSTTARRGVATLALAVGLALAVAAPASAAGHAGKASKHHRSGHAATGAAHRMHASGAALGPAVKYHRNADGSVSRVR